MDVLVPFTPPPSGYLPAPGLCDYIEPGRALGAPKKMLYFLCEYCMTKRRGTWVLVRVLVLLYGYNIPYNNTTRIID